MLLGWFGLDLGLEWLSLVRRGWLLVALGGGGESGAAPPAERDTATGATRGGVDEVRAGGRCASALWPRNTSRHGHQGARGSARYGDPPPLLPWIDPPPSPTSNYNQAISFSIRHDI